MNRACRLLLVVWCTLGLSVSMPTAFFSGVTFEGRAEARSADDRSVDDLERHWDDVATFLRQGAYSKALVSLDVILSATPNDSRARLYQELCRLRLANADVTFTPLPPPQLDSLKAKLRQEERDQKRTQAQLKALKRQMKKEQTTWDRELDQLDEQAKRDEQRKAKQAKLDEQQRQARARADAIKQKKSEAAKRAEAKRAAAKRQVERDRTPPQQRAARPTPPAPAVPAPPAAPAAAPAVAPTGVSGAAGDRPAESATPVAGPMPTRGVELSPVTVPPADEPEPRSPSLVAARTLPPKGAVQINASQMSVSPDRKIAFADGNVEVAFENAFLTCDHLTLFTDTKDVYAEGRVRLEEGTQVFRGEMMHYNFDSKKGRFLQGTVSSPPWHQHGRTVEHLAEGIYEVTPGYFTSCELEPPHFRFAGHRNIVYAEDARVHSQHSTFVVDQLPLIYLPWLVLADNQSPFFLIPGKKKPWGQFALMGYRYRLPGPDNHEGALRLDWRRHFGWGVGTDHKFDSERLGKGLLKLYYNDLKNRTSPNVSLPKGATDKRYRALWRHVWEPEPGTTVVTDLQDFSDEDFRKDFLFHDEFMEDDIFDSFLSVVKSTRSVSMSGLVRKRMNRFQSVDELLPQVTFDMREQQIGETNLFSQTRVDVANFETKRRHSGNDTDVVRVDLFERLRYALNWFRPVMVTPNLGVRQTYYTKDIQSGSGPDDDRTQGQRDRISGQFSTGADVSLKLFRIFPVTTNALGLDLNLLRHVLTPTVSHSYIRRPTILPSLVTFSGAEGATNAVTFGLENKLQTKRGGKGVDIARFTTSLPYTFRGNHNKRGGRLGDWSFDLEVFPWSWLRLESDWTIPSHFVRGTRDDRLTLWNGDLVMVGGPGGPEAKNAPSIQGPRRRTFEPGLQKGIAEFLPPGQWYLGLGHRYTQNSKTETVLQFDWGVSEKWEIGTFHRFTWKEVAGTSKRLRNTREWQYALRRDLHDWVGELLYRVDREFGEELFLTVTLKAFPNLPFEIGDSYHQPKRGSQSSAFFPGDVEG